MKTTLYTIKGEKKGNIELPKIFEKPIREDIAHKYFEAVKLAHIYSSDPEGGKKHSASGTISHKRHDWKGHYGRGISRIPRKTMWRRGTQFMWIGAEISGTRGGRRAHPPKGIGKEKKINKKEIKIAMETGFASTGKEDYVLKRYGSLEKLDVKTPVVVQSDFNKTKVKELIAMLNKIFEKEIRLVLKDKRVRAGRGKLRGRKYKSNAGVLFIKAKDEEIKMKGIDIKSTKEVSISDLYPLGRLTVYTSKALDELEKEAKK